MNRREFIRNSAGILVPAAGLLVPRLARSQILPPILTGGFNAGGGGTSIALDGAEQHAYDSFGTTLGAISLTTAGTNRLVIYGLALDGDGDPSITPTVSGSTLGAFTLAASDVLSANGAFSYVFIAWAASQLTTESITVNFGTNAQVAYCSCIAVSGSKNMTLLTPGTNYGIATGHASTNTPSVSLTTKVANSWTFAMIGQTSNIGSAYTAAASNAIYSQNTTNGNGEASFHRSDEPLAVGTYTLGVSCTTATNWSISAIEILVGP